MNASSESGLWATRMIRDMGPRGWTSRRRSAASGGRVGGAAKFVDRRLVLLVLHPARGAFGGEMGEEVARGLAPPGGIVLNARHRPADHVAEQVARVARQDGVGQG